MTNPGAKVEHLVCGAGHVADMEQADPARYAWVVEHLKCEKEEAAHAG